MELDGYNKFYQIAFEFQGEQHFKNISFFSSNNLKYNQAKDKLKVSLCKKNGVLLFVISNKFDLIKLPTLIKEKINLKLKIYKKLNKKGSAHASLRFFLPAHSPQTSCR